MKKEKNTLKVIAGIAQPDQINRELVKNLKDGKSRKLNVNDYIQGILAGDRTILSQAITLVESSLHKHQEMAEEIIEECLKRGTRDERRGTKKLRITNYELRRKSNPASGIRHPASSIQHPAMSLRAKRSNSIRIGITGVPGVGKSTFIEALGKYLTGKGHKVAVLAIDPSSKKTKGSILGDKTRMEELAVDPDAFIRPSPAAGSPGGVARKTRETILLCEAAGFDVIFIETVGVGQSETAVHSMVDFFLLLMLAGAGDELQGIKRGIIEMADAIIINKADGDNLMKAKAAKNEFTHALHLFPPPETGWKPGVELCSSLTKEGIPQVWETITRYREFAVKTGWFENKRQQQGLQMMYDTIDEKLKSGFFGRKDISHHLKKLEQEIADGKINPYLAAQLVLEKFF